MLYTGSHFLIKGLKKIHCVLSFFLHWRKYSSTKKLFIFSGWKDCFTYYNTSLWADIPFLSLCLSWLFSFCPLQLPFPALSHPQIRHIPAGCPAIRWRQLEAAVGEGEAWRVPHATFYPPGLSEPLAGDDWSGCLETSHGKKAFAASHVTKASLVT